MGSGKESLFCRQQQTKKTVGMTVVIGHPRHYYLPIINQAFFLLNCLKSVNPTYFTYYIFTFHWVFTLIMPLMCMQPVAFVVAISFLLTSILLWFEVSV
jgi:hypothetical protein